MYLNFKKLAKFTKDKREELGLTQRAFAKWIEETYKENISYGTISKLENPNNDSIPEFKTFFILSQLADLSIDEFFTFLQDDSIETINEMGAYKEQEKKLDANPNRFLELFKNLPPENKMVIFSVLAEQVSREAQEAFKLQALVKGLQS